MAKEFNTIDEWLGHRGTERGGGGYLGKWKDDGHIDVWLHRRRLPVSLWQHQFPKPNVFEDKETGEPRKVFWGRAHNCHEDETVLKKRFRRRRGDDAREVPPVSCPICLLAEALRDMVRSEKIRWTDRVFVFKGATNPDDNVTLHAGGIYGAFAGKLDDDELDDLRDAGIKPSEAWKENCLVKENAVFCVVDNEHPEDGVQIAVQTGLLGEKVRGVINDEIASKGDEGNPVKHPYCIQWIYRSEKNLPFDKKYHARRIDRHKLTPEIAELIGGDPPDLSGTLEKMDKATLRAVMEQYAVVDLPWDRIFVDDDGAAVPARRAANPVERREEPRTGRRRRVEEPPPPPQKEMIPCDECKTPMPEDATKCKACGAVYELEPDSEPAPKLDAKKVGKAMAATTDPKGEPTFDDGDIPF